METRRWWNLAIIAMTTLLSAIIVFDRSEPMWRLVGALSAIILFAVAWFALAPAARRDSPAAVALTVTVVVLAGFGTGFTPTFAIIQFVAFPLVWNLTCVVRRAIIANVALCLSVAGGFIASLGTSQAALMQTALTAALSLGFSIAFGLWITHIADLSDERRRTDSKQLQSEAQSQPRRRSAVQSGMRPASASAWPARCTTPSPRDLTGPCARSRSGRRSRPRRRTTPRPPPSASHSLEDAARDSPRRGPRRWSPRPPHPRVDEAGTELLDALERLARALTRAGDRGRASTVATGVGPAPSTASLEVVLLRCTQEALSNVRKHAQASSVQIRVDASAAGVHLSVTDDGRGFTESGASGYGLQGMRERLALVGGSLTIVNGRGAEARGTALAIDLPVGASA